MLRNKNANLSRRQLQCLHLVGRGATSKQIARELGISPSTVDNHVRLAMERLDTKSRIEAARIIEFSEFDDYQTTQTAVTMTSIAHSLDQIIDCLVHNKQIETSSHVIRRSRLYTPRLRGSFHRS
jgi:DNA-binding CsgD family transcriptional regulator